MTEQRRIDKLRHLARAYGQASYERAMLLHSFGRDLVEALNSYLGPSDGLPLVYPTAPHGDWKPDEDYHDAAFSDYGGGLLDLRDLDMGLSVRIDNLADDGAFWLRLVLTLRRMGERIEVDVPGVGIERVPSSGWTGADLGRVCSAIELSLSKTFREEIDSDREGLYRDGRIGFLGKIE